MGIEPTITFLFTVKRYASVDTFLLGYLYVIKKCFIILVLNKLEINFAIPFPNFQDSLLGSELNAALCLPEQGNDKNIHSAVSQCHNGLNTTWPYTTIEPTPPSLATKELSHETPPPPPDQ